MEVNYSAPECTLLTIEVRSVLATSPVNWENNIKDPSWNTGGDYGLE